MMSGVLSSGESFPLMALFAGGGWSGEPGAFLLALAEAVVPFMLTARWGMDEAAETRKGWPKGLDSRIRKTSDGVDEMLGLGLER